ncbi:MAG TPA: fatty acid desaturase [Planctomycetota bacterium]
MIELSAEDAVPAVVLKDILTPEEIKSFRKPSGLRQVVDFSLVWIQILLGIGLFVWSPAGIPPALVYLASILLIGGGQHGLQLVGHEFAHYNVVPGSRRLNDFLGTWFFAAPSVLPLPLFRHRHFAHHRHYSTPNDTKTIYRSEIRGARLWIEILKKLLMFEYYYHVYEVFRDMRAEVKAKDPTAPSLLRILPPIALTQVVLFAALWPIHPLAYLFLWAVPLLTVQTVFNNLRAITEHQPPRALGGNPSSPYFLGTPGPFVRTAVSNLFERLFICKINFGYHVEHHLWPQINYQFLPTVHRRLLDKGVFSDPRFGLEASYLGNIAKLAAQPSDDRAWHARPPAKNIRKQPVPQCPLCDAARKRPLYRVKEHEYDNTTDDPFQMVECGGCGAWYLDPRPADAELPTIYPPNYYTNVLEASSSLDVERARKGAFMRLGTWLFKRRIRPIERHQPITPETRWLDIGCGGGLALEAMRQAYGARGVGVDMSERAVAICRQRGFEAHAVRFEDFTPASGSRFHLIHSSHLIEHVGSPLAYLKKVYDLLEPGGVTVFITPNTRTWESRLFRHHWGGLHVPRHWVLFQDESARRAAERVGFEHLETVYSTNSQFWIWTLHSLAGRFISRGLRDALFPSDHRFVKSNLWTILRGGAFTAVDILNVLFTGRSANMAVILRKPATPPPPAAPATR